MRMKIDGQVKRTSHWALALGVLGLGCALACTSGVEQDESKAGSTRADDGADGGSAAADDGADDNGTNPSADDGAGDDGAGDDADDGAGDDTSSGDPNADPACATPAPGAAPLRRLTNAEYINTATDLVQDAELVARVTKDFPREPTSLGFRNNAQALTVTPLVADQYVRAAEELGKAAVALPGAIPCDVATADAECTLSFVQTFGARVYRRPLVQADLKRYSDLYNAIVAETTDKQLAFETMAAAMFSSSNFLFRVELSASGTDPSMPSAYEMASRLSYLLWQTMPDEELFAAAAAGDLETKKGVQTQVNRMMRDEKARRVYEFFEQWLDIDEVDAISRNEDTYPQFNPQLVALLKAENQKFIYDLLYYERTFADMLASDYTYANRSLAEHYGLSTLPENATFVEVPAPDRAGVLTQAMMLINDRATRTSIVKRGLKIRTDFLCQIVPAPPADVDTTLPELNGDMTQRERLAAHRTEAGCAGCHNLMDPIGEIFEPFDALGRPRSTDEAGATIVTGGSISNTKTLNGDYANPRELALAMAESDEVRKCFVLQAFRFFYGRDATAQDKCTQEQLYANFASDGYKVVDLLKGLAKTDQFLYRAASSDVANGEQQ